MSCKNVLKSMTSWNELSCVGSTAFCCSSWHDEVVSTILYWLNQWLYQAFPTSFYLCLGYDVFQGLYTVSGNSEVFCTCLIWCHILHFESANCDICWCILCWNFLQLMVTSITKCWKLPQKFKIVETYWHDHSLESYWGAFSDGTISFRFNFLRNNPFSEFFSKNLHPKI
jgi:hypothetical protein